VKYGRGMVMGDGLRKGVIHSQTFSSGYGS